VSAALQKISVISLFVEDLPTTKAFYSDVFGLPFAYEDESSAVVQFENMMINLLKVEEASSLVEPLEVAAAGAGSRFQISVWVDDVDAVCVQLTKKGVTLLTEPRDREWGMRTATFADPAGNSWEVAQGIGGGEG